MKPILVYGATGFTGKLVVAALAKMGVTDVILGGRDAARLKALSAQAGGLEYRVADATRPETLGPLVRGVHVVVDTAGPFQLFGEPVVKAALDAGAHFLDTTGEQPYMRRILERYDARGRAAERVVINAQAFEFGLGYCASALLAEADPTLHTVDVFHRVLAPVATRGTAKSAVGVIVEDVMVLKDGRLSLRGRSLAPMKVRVPAGAANGATVREELAIPFPGGEALHLPRAYPRLLNVTTNMVLPATFARLAMLAFPLQPVLRVLQQAGAMEPVLRRIDRGPEGPTHSQRERQDFKVFARGRGGRGARGVLVSGADPYGLSGVIAALGAKWLVERTPLRTGVVSTDQAFGARPFLDALAPYGVTTELVAVDA